MIVDRVEHPGWLSNAYLLADGPGGHGVLVDGNGLTGELIERAERERIRITHVLCTHGHADHVVELEEIAGRLGATLVAHPLTAVAATKRVRHGDTLATGELEIEVLETPGHCKDHLAYLVDETFCLTADCLFRGTVGGTAGPGGDLDELKHSILVVLLALDPATMLLPGHREATTVEAEQRSNPFVRAWVQGEWPDEEPCLVAGEPATLLLWAPDYDGGHKALVRLADGTETIVGGSRVERR
jgi:hydroxyacylglutathione hydrolase